MSSIRDSARS